MTRVLLVDDDDTLLFAFRKLCESSGISVETANSLDGGLRLLGNDHFDIVFSDLNLSGSCKQEGFEIIRAAKLRTPSIRAFIWSAYDENQEVDGNSAVDIEGYLIKPVKFDSLLSIISQRPAAGPPAGG